MNRIEKKFNELKKANKKAFISFITAGYPDLKTTESLVREFEKRGVDIVELGVPFSDPLADGPIIQRACEASLRKGTNLYKILELVKELRKDVKIPICLMSYYNPIFCFGEEKFLREAKTCGVDGLIVPDLPPEEGKNLIRLSQRYNIDIILFISPTTTLERTRFITKKARGFIYYVSLTGVTGARESLSSDLIKNLKIIKKLTSKPVCVGFGVSKPQHLRQIFKFADGAIVGSAIVERIRRSLGKKDLVDKVGSFIENLRR